MRLVSCGQDFGNRSEGLSIGYRVVGLQPILALAENPLK